MDIFIIALLIFIAVVLLLAELFLLPGVTVAGILAAGGFVCACYYAFSAIGTGGGVITILVSVAACAGSIVWFIRSKTLDNLALQQRIDSQIDRSAELQVRPGDSGVTTTRLALIGYADIEGKIVEVKSEDGFLDEKTPVTVSRIVGGTIMVERKKQ